MELMIGHFLVELWGQRLLNLDRALQQWSKVDTRKDLTVVDYYLLFLRATLHHVLL